MKTRIQETLEQCLADDETIALADGFEIAFLGVARQFGTPFAVYDKDRCLAALLDQGLSIEDAEEWFSFNTEGAWVGKNTPAFLVPAVDDWEKDRADVIVSLAHKTFVLDTLLRLVLPFVNPSLASSDTEKDICLEALHAARVLLKEVQ